MILAIETSCDETCAAVVSIDGAVRSSIVASQAAEHVAYGGVVPEIASRRHLELLKATVDAALRDAACNAGDLTAVAVTTGPGLIGALLVGLSFAKGYAYASGIPLIGVDHLQGHVASLRLANVPPTGAYLVLLASGGHTLLLDVEADGSIETIARSMDDAAGEAFDKGARLLGLGYPGGPALAELADHGDASRAPLTTPLKRRNDLAFSFSGLKTQLALRVRQVALDDSARADLAAAYQEAIVDHLVDRARLGLAATGRATLGLVGGVAATRCLREQLDALSAEVVLAPIAWCGDNAAMIGLAACSLPPLAASDALVLDAHSRSPLG